MKILDVLKRYKKLFVFFAMMLVMSCAFCIATSAEMIYYSDTVDTLGVDFGEVGILDEDVGLYNFFPPTSNGDSSYNCIVEPGFCTGDFCAQIRYNRTQSDGGFYYTWSYGFNPEDYVYEGGMSTIKGNGGYLSYAFISASTSFMLFYNVPDYSLSCNYYIELELGIYEYKNSQYSFLELYTTRVNFTAEKGERVLSATIPYTNYDSTKKCYYKVSKVTIGCDSVPSNAGTLVLNVRSFYFASMWPIRYSPRVLDKIPAIATIKVEVTPTSGSPYYYTDRVGFYLDKTCIKFEQIYKYCYDFLASNFKWTMNDIGQYMYPKEYKIVDSSIKLYLDGAVSSDTQYLMFSESYSDTSKWYYNQFDNAKYISFVQGNYSTSLIPRDITLQDNFSFLSLLPICKSFDVTPLSYEHLDIRIFHDAFNAYVGSVSNGVDITFEDWKNVGCFPYLYLLDGTDPLFSIIAVGSSSYESGFQAGYAGCESDNRKTWEDAAYSEGYTDCESDNRETWEDAAYSEGYTDCESDNRKTWEDAAYSEGYIDCESDNRDAWEDAAYSEGYADCELDNRAHWESTAYNDGYSKGYDKGDENGYNRGYSVGKAQSDKLVAQTNYNNGYSEGLAAGKAISDEQVKKTSYSEGYNKGYADGYDSALIGDDVTQKLNLKYKEGYSNGYSNGKSAGYDLGIADYTTNNLPAEKARSYDAGYFVGYQEGYDAGEDKFYDKGYADGYEHGYSAGTLSDPISDFGSLLVEVPVGVVSTYSSVLNFNVLGINIMSLVGSILFLMIVIYIIGKIKI